LPRVVASFAVAAAAVMVVALCGLVLYLMTSLSRGPTAGIATELRFAFAPFQATKLASLNLVFQHLGGLETAVSKDGFIDFPFA